MSQADGEKHPLYAGGVKYQSRKEVGGVQQDGG